MDCDWVVHEVYMCQDIVNWKCNGFVIAVLVVLYRRIPTDLFVIWYYSYAYIK